MKTCSFRSALVSLLLAIAPNAFGWGVLQQLGQEDGHVFLVHKVLDAQRIRYCMDLQDRRFHHRSMALQTEASIKLWMAPLKSMKVRMPVLEEVSCSSQNVDLRVWVGEVTGHYKPYGAFMTIEGATPPARHVQITINTGWYHEADPQRLFPHRDFGERTRFELQNLTRLIGSFQKSGIRRVDDLSRKWGENPMIAIMESYPILIHEMGHAFGLCDTYKGPHPNCDPARSYGGAHSDSVMMSSLYFHLLPDDIAGIRTLFRQELDRRR